MWTRGRPHRGQVPRPATACPGASTIAASSRAPSASSAQATAATSSRRGCPSLDGVVAKLERGREGRRRRLRPRRIHHPDGRRLTPSRASSASTRTAASIDPARERAAEARDGRPRHASRWPSATELPRPRTTISSATSIASTTWRDPDRRRRGGSRRRSRPDGTLDDRRAVRVRSAARTTTTPSAGSSTRRPRCSACPHSLARRGPALGAQAGEARLPAGSLARPASRSFRRATETPFNLVLEARP